jgi:hypothetical protein
MLSRVMSVALAGMTLAVASPVLAQSGADDARFAQAQSRFDREYQLYRQEVDVYQAARSRGGYRQPAYPQGNDGYRRAPDTYGDDDGDDGAYDPARDYRTGPNYRERVLSSDDRVYAGYDGRYYCRRSDGTTGLIVGGAAGGVLGNVIDGGRSRTVGTLLGAAAGALAGRAVEQNQQQVRCR